VQFVYNIIMDSYAKYALRWAVNTTAWNPEEEEWEFLLKLIPVDDQTSVRKFKFKEDQKRALVSRLLQRRCCQTALGIEWSDIAIKRTKGRKPFLSNPANDELAPNFNFNVSHEGDYVVLASEPLCLCGIDCAAPQQLRRGKPQTIQDIHKTFKDNFTEYEWQTIFNAGSSNAQEDAFRCHWSLKEAFTKARGDGIAFELKRCSFSMVGDWPSSQATVAVDGVEQDGWTFSLQQLAGEHWVSVARGPVNDAIDAYGEFRGTFKAPDMTVGELQDALKQEAPSISMLTLADLVPPERLDEFEQAGGDVY